MSTSAKSALLLTGGGARAAYQVGVLRSWGRAFPELHFPILTGVSAGAINAASLANSTAGFAEAVAELTRHWEELAIQDVFRTDFRHLSLNMLRWGFRLISGGAHLVPSTRGMVDTSPLKAFLCRALQSEDGALHGVEENIRCGRLSALGITTTHYPTGQSATWVQGETLAGWRGPGQHGIPARLTVDHIMASCALPLVFPAVHLADGWHGDGGVRLTAPLAPAIHLGADRIIAISTFIEPARAEADMPDRDYPPPAAIIGVLFNSVFLDALDRDAMELRLVNQLLAGQSPDSRSGRQPVELFLLRPSQDLDALAGEFEAELPTAFRHIVRGLGTHQTNRSDFIATLLFLPGYIKKVMAIGEQDGERHLSAIATFLGLPPPQLTAPTGRLEAPVASPPSSLPIAEPATLAA